VRRHTFRSGVKDNEGSGLITDNAVMRSIDRLWHHLSGREMLLVAFVVFHGDLAGEKRRQS
jgi:hypothetical protein